MTRIRFEDLPSTNTPINAENLNKLNNVIVSSEEPTTGEEVWLEKGENLIDKNLLIFGMELDGNGGTIVRSNYYITPFIEIESNTIYTFKGAKSLKGVDNYYKDYYDKDYNFISSNEFSTFTTPSNAKYVRFNGCSDFTIDLQLEKGEKITPKKIHTKTDNGYEEFTNISEIENNINNLNTDIGKKLTKLFYGGTEGGGTIDTGLTIFGGYGGGCYLVVNTWHLSGSAGGLKVSLLALPVERGTFKEYVVCDIKINESYSKGFALSVSEKNTLKVQGAGGGAFRTSVYRL